MLYNISPRTFFRPHQTRRDLGYHRIRNNVERNAYA